MTQKWVWWRFRKAYFCLFFCPFLVFVCVEFLSAISFAKNYPKIASVLAIISISLKQLKMLQLPIRFRCKRTPKVQWRLFLSVSEELSAASTHV